MAAQHLPRDLVRPGSGLKELGHTMKQQFQGCENDYRESDPFQK